ncbi:MAG TPA: multiheme c-type cytochrome [Candidatus Acidoferrum sp.]|nr:multiheme c-type cytochrome [Candidatus Acidoferrum sp.]
MTTAYPSRQNPRYRVNRLHSLLVLAALVCFPWNPAWSQQLPPAPTVTTSVSVADSICAKCHQQIYESYLETPMAKASGAAIDGTIAGGFTDEVSGVQFSVFTKDGAAWLSYDRPGTALNGQQKLEYFLGSGSHARTYLYSRNGYWFESPAVYYSEKNGYSMRPSFHQDKEMPFNLPIDPGCIRCHVSGALNQDAGTQNHYSGVPFLHGGITCESCHGDTTQHVASGGKAPLVNLAGLDPDRRDSVCLNCHLEGDSNIDHRGVSIRDFKPGDNITDFVSYYVRAGAGATNRGVSQVEALDLSMCKRMSGDRMTCTTCHDPHYTPPAFKRAAFFRAECLACHNEPKFATAHYSTNPDCTTCHMPQKQAPDLAHSEWTDHRILAQPQRSAPDTPANNAVTGTPTGVPTLIPVPGVRQSPNSRDTALAYYNMVENGHEEFAMQAWTLLQETVKTDPDDPKVLAALGFLAEVNGDRAKALQYYQSTLKYDPGNYTAAMNLAVLMARSGDLKSAAQLWQTTFAHNEDITGLGMNLAAARCMLGDKAAAEEVLQRVLVYSPDHQAAREELAAIAAGQQPCPAQ